MGSGGGGGGTGRELSQQELLMIEAQTQAFRNDQQRQAALYGAASNAATGAIQSNYILGQQIGDSTRQIGAINQRAFEEGTTRRDQEEALLRQYLGAPAQIQGLANQIRDPNYGNILNTAMARAGTAYTPAGTSTLRAVQAAGLRGASGAPLNTSIMGIQNLGSRDFVDPQVQALMDIGVNDPTFAQRLGQLGARPGAAEAALSTNAIRTLQQAQMGNVPTAVQSLYSGTDTAARAGLENQFNAARQRLMESGVTGGALTRALAGLEGQRAMGVAQQVEARENEARNFSANLLNQATTYGLNQPFARQQLQLEALRAGGQLGVNEAMARTQALQASGNLGLQQLQARGGLLQAAGDLRARQAEMQQGYLNTARLGATSLGDQALQYEQLRNQNLGLAGQLATQQFQGQLAANQARQQALTTGLGAAIDLGGRLGAGGDALAYQTSPALATQLVQLRQLQSQSQGIPIDILRGGTSGQSVDLTGALSALGRAEEFVQGPSRGAKVASSALSGAAMGATIGGPYGAAIGGAAGLAMGFFV